MTDLHESENELSGQLRQIPFDEEARSDHQDRLRARALAAFDAAQSRSRGNWKRTINLGRTLMRHPLARLTVTAAACVAFLAIWVFTPGRQSSAFAFHRFAEAIVNAKTATFQIDVAVEGQPKQSVEHAYYMVPGKYRYEMAGTVSIADYVTAKTIMLIPASKQALVMNMKLSEIDREHGAFDPFGRLQQLLSDSRPDHERYESLGEKEIEGKRAVGFRYRNAMGALTMWGDPASGLPVLVETVYDSGVRAVVTMRDFRVDVALEPELFEPEIPDDYDTRTFDVDASQITENDLLKALRAVSDTPEHMFLDSLDTPGVAKAMSRVLKTRADDTLDDKSPELMLLSVTLGRGIGFVNQLPESAEAHYAGKGVRRDQPDRPIFWYKPVESKRFRVIYADLSVKEMDQPPRVPGAVRITKEAPSEPVYADPEE